MAFQNRMLPVSDPASSFSQLPPWLRFGEKPFYYAAAQEPDDGEGLPILLVETFDE